MNILIATDGSADSASALDFVLRFPFPDNSTMTVLTVVSGIPMLPEEIDALDDSQVSSLDEVNRELYANAEELVHREESRLGEGGWAVEAIVRMGSPIDEILRVAEEIDADLIVLGSHGMGMAERFLLGSVSDRVLEYARCSVLIVKQKAGETGLAPTERGSNAPCKIMLAYDMSGVSREALRLCASLPMKEGCEVEVVYVMPLITAYRQDIRQRISDIWQHKKRVIKAELKKAVADLQWSTSSVKTSLREAESVTDEIMAAVEEAGSDLVMFGCKDRGAFKDLLHGSITRSMARTAECTVWAVRTRE